MNNSPYLDLPRRSLARAIADKVSGNPEFGSQEIDNFCKGLRPHSDWLARKVKDILRSRM